MPRKPNNDPAVLLERANKQRERWSKAQTTYLERPENKEKHQEAVNSYYERNKERLRQKANERNAKKREANKPATETKAEVEPPKENVMEKAVSALRKVETETKKRNRNRKVAAQLQQVVADTNARNADRKREMMNRSQMAKEDKDAEVLLPIVKSPLDAYRGRGKKAPKNTIEMPTLHISELDETAKDNEPKTLPQKTEDELKRQVENNEFPKEINTYWNPPEIAEWLQVAKIFRKEGIRITEQDYRERPYLMRMSDDEIATHLKADEDKLKKMDEKTNYSDRDWTTQRRHLEDNIKAWKRHKEAMKKWKPVRMFQLRTFTNFHDVAKFEEKITPQLKSLPRVATQYLELLKMRVAIMDEINKTRSNPIRNISLAMTLTPAETYIVASWDIHRSSDRHSWYGEIIVHQNKITEYNIENGKVVEFKSKDTLAREKAEADKQAEKDKEGIVGDDGLVHTMKNGHKVSFRKGMKQFAKFDDLYTIESKDKLPDDVVSKLKSVFDSHNFKRESKTFQGEDFEYNAYHSYEVALKVVSQGDRNAEIDIMAIQFGSGMEKEIPARTIPLSPPIRTTIKLSKTKAGMILPKYIKQLADNSYNRFDLKMIPV